MLRTLRSEANSSRVSSWFSYNWWRWLSRATACSQTNYNRWTCVLETWWLFAREVRKRFSARGFKTIWLSDHFLVWTWPFADRHVWEGVRTSKKESNAIVTRSLNTLFQIHRFSTVRVCSWTIIKQKWFFKRVFNMMNVHEDKPGDNIHVATLISGFWWRPDPQAQRLVCRIRTCCSRTCVMLLVALAAIFVFSACLRGLPLRIAVSRQMYCLACHSKN